MHIRSFPYVAAVVLTALALPTLALANPSAETPQTATAGTIAANSWETDTSPVTLSVYVDSPTQLRLTTFWGIDPVSVRWKEDTGIDLEWVIAPDDSQAKLNVLMASGDLPNLIHLSQELPQIRQLADNGLVWNVRELSESHAPGVWDYLWNRNKHVIVHFRTLFDSMDIFMVPFQHLPQDYVDSPYAIRAYQGTTAQDVILDNAGNPKVASTADYVDLLRTVKAAHPELIPVQSMRNASPSRDGDPQLVQAALSIAGLSQRYFDIDGTWVKYWEHPNFVALLRFANTLYTERLLDPTEFTDSKSALKAKGLHGTGVLRALAGRGQHAALDHQDAGGPPGPELRHAAALHDRPGHDALHDRRAGRRDRRQRHDGVHVVESIPTGRSASSTTCIRTTSSG